MAAAVVTAGATPALAADRRPELTADVAAPAGNGPERRSDSRPSTGGAAFFDRPVLRWRSCLRRCGPGGESLPGGLLRLRGRGLAAVTRVVFHGRPGADDDVAVRVRPRGPRRLTVRVPVRAVSGPVSAVVDARLRSLPALRVRIGRPATEPALALTLQPAALRPADGPAQPGAPRIETGLDRVRAFYGERAGVTFSYRVSAPEPVSAQVELVTGADGQVVETWPQASVPLGREQSVTWRGTAAGGVAADGRYAFRLIAQGSGGTQARSAQATEPRDSFDFRDHIFPVRGRHRFTGGGARFGAGRGGRSHQGHDLFAPCGTSLVAARGGAVEFVQFHAAAGHYLVIDGEGTDEDYVYMHLQGPPPLRRGQRVYTGQPIGAVGSSGNAVGCHLHFEMWSAPGWYRGGRPHDPLPALREWDAGS